jgi:hypothetical protein
MLRPTFQTFSVLTIAATATATPLPADKSNQVVQRHWRLAAETSAMVSAAVMTIRGVATPGPTGVATPK